MTTELERVALAIRGAYDLGVSLPWSAYEAMAQAAIDARPSAPPIGAETAIPWCIDQAESIMAIAAGVAKTADDATVTSLGHINSIASDIAINLQMLAAASSEARKG